MIEPTKIKTYYLTRNIKSMDGRKFGKGGSIQTADPEMQKWIEDQLNTPGKTIPISKPVKPPKEKAEE